MISAAEIANKNKALAAENYSNFSSFLLVQFMTILSSYQRFNNGYRWFKNKCFTATVVY
jgi:hypothetical protein